MLNQQSEPATSGLVNNYNRPNAKWECGHLSSGCPCSIGPTAKGECSGGVGCYPAKEGDTWICSRPDHQGGKCEQGPQPGGECCQVRKCRPNLTLRHRRRMLAFSCVWILIGGCLILWGSGNSNEALVPGPLSSSHAQLLMHKGNDRCASCHPAAHKSLGDWVQSAFTGKPLVADGKTQSQFCLECHKANIDPKWSLTAHNLSDWQTELIQGRKTVNKKNAIQTAGLSFGNTFEVNKNKPQACASCHQEHHGSESLVDRTNKRCLSCHQQDTTCFETNHPKFRSWPAKITKSIQFNHATHSFKHFPTNGKEFNCLSCHKADEDGNVMKVASYQQACASCHNKQILQSSAEGWALIQLPMLDVETLNQSGVKIGVWPEELKGDFDGKIPSWTRMLLQADSRAQKALKRIGPDMELIDIDPESSQDLKAAAAIGLAMKRLLLDLAVRGQSGIRNRLEIVLKRPVSESELKQLGYGFSRSMVQDAVARWFPNLKEEVDQNFVFPNSPFANPNPVAGQKKWSPEQIFGRLQEQEILATNPLSGSLKPETNKREGSDGQKSVTSSQVVSEPVVSRKPNSKPSELSSTNPSRRRGNQNYLAGERSSSTSGFKKTPEPNPFRERLQASRSDSASAQKQQDAEQSGDQNSNRGEVLAPNPFKRRLQNQNSVKNQNGSPENITRPQGRSQVRNNGSATNSNTSPSITNTDRPATREENPFRKQISQSNSNARESSSGRPQENGSVQISNSNGFQLPPVNQEGDLLVRNPLKGNTRSTQQSNRSSRNSSGSVSQDSSGSVKQQNVGQRSKPANGSGQKPQVVIQNPPRTQQFNGSSLPPQKPGELLHKNSLVTGNRNQNQPKKAAGSDSVIGNKQLAEKAKIEAVDPGRRVVNSNQEVQPSGKKDGAKTESSPAKSRPVASVPKIDWDSFSGKMGTKQGWLRNDQQFSIRYHATGHEDAFMKSWLDLASKHRTLSSSNSVNALYKEIGEAHSVGNCMQCHNPTNPSREKETVLALLGLPNPSKVDGNEIENAVQRNSGSNRSQIMTAKGLISGRTNRFQLVSSSADDSLKKLKQRVEQTEGLAPAITEHVHDKWVHWKGVYRDPLVRGFTKFSHRPHMMIAGGSGCASCHQLDENAAGIGHQLVRFSEFKPITIENCSKCHREGGSSNDCSTCHSYHVGSRIKK